MNQRVSIALLVTSLFLAQAFAQERSPQGPIAHDQAVLMARHAAFEHGYDLEKYSLLPYPPANDLSEDGKDWFFLYVCKKPSLDCGFSVAVNRTTAAIEVRSLP